MQYLRNVYLQARKNNDVAFSPNILYLAIFCPKPKIEKYGMD